MRVHHRPPISQCHSARRATLLVADLRAQSGATTERLSLRAQPGPRARPDASDCWSSRHGSSAWTCTPAAADTTITAEQSATAMRSSVVGHALGFGQTRAEDPHELRRGRCAHLGPSVRQMVLDGRVRQAKAVSGCLLRSGDQDGRDHTDLPVGGAFGARRADRRVMRSATSRTARAARRAAS